MLNNELLAQKAVRFYAMPSLVIAEHLHFGSACAYHETLHCLPYTKL